MRQSNPNNPFILTENRQLNTIEQVQILDDDNDDEQSFSLGGDDSEALNT